MAIQYDEMGNVISGDVDAVAVAASPAQLDYYRAKVAEFQSMLIQLDSVSEIASGLLWSSQADDPEFSSDIEKLLNEFDAKKATFRTVAEALNFGIEGVNRLGVDFSKVVIPSGLGVVPLAAAAGIAGALALAASLIVWGREWIAGVNERAKRAQLLDVITDPQEKARVAADLARLDQAQSAADSSPLGSIATMIKWGAIAAMAWFAYSAYSKAR